MYRKGDLVEVREFSLKIRTTKSDRQWIESWIPGVITALLGETELRTGIARFETLEVASVLINGKIRKVPTRNLRYPNE